MRFVCKTKLEKAWLAASVTAFVLHRLLEVEPDAGAMWLVEAAMIVLSFPCGPIAMLFILMGVEGVSDQTDLSWLLDWSTLLFIGYIQWFWMLPEMRRNNQLLTLHLAPPVEVVSALPPDDSTTFPETTRRVIFSSANFVPPLTEFDEAGLTALGRVLQAQQEEEKGKSQPPAPPVSRHS